MTDQSPASFPRPDAPLVLLGASGLGEIGEAREVGQERILWSLASGRKGGKHHFEPGSMSAVSLVPDIVLFTPRAAGGQSSGILFLSKGFLLSCRLVPSDERGSRS